MQLLYIVSDFLPNHTGGTVRAIKHAKYFKRAGVAPIIFTQQLGVLPPSEKLQDIQIVRSRPFNVGLLYQRIKNRFRIKKPAKTNIYKSDLVSVPITKQGRLADLVFVPDVDIVWALAGVWKAFRTVRENNIQVVLSSGPSHANHILAFILCTRFKNLKWVAEFRDPWITNPFRDNKWPAFEQFDRWLEKKVIKRSDAIIVTSEKYKQDFLRRYPSLNEHKIRFIPNGYDGEDFEFLKQVEKGSNALYTVISTGNYYQKRSLLPFLKAIRLLLDRNPEFSNQFQFISYGQLDVAAQAYVDQYPLSQVQLKGYIPHKECLLEMYKADALLLIPGPGDGTMPGKTFEYLAAGTTILALVDEGPSKQIVEDIQAGIIVPTEDVEGIASALKTLILQGFQPYRSASAEQMLQKFDRAQLSTQVLDTLNEVCI